MTMTQLEALLANRSLVKIYEQDVSGLTAKHIFDAMNALAAPVAFYNNERQRIFNRHPHVNPEDLTISGLSEEETRAEIMAVNQEFDELCELKQEVDVVPFIIHLNQDRLRISGKDISNLKGIVTFVGGEEA